MNRPSEQTIHKEVEQLIEECNQLNIENSNNNSDISFDIGQFNDYLHTQSNITKYSSSLSPKSIKVPLEANFNESQINTKKNIFIESNINNDKAMCFNVSDQNNISDNYVDYIEKLLRNINLQEIQEHERSIEQALHLANQNLNLDNQQSQMFNSILQEISNMNNQYEPTNNQDSNDIVVITNTNPTNIDSRQMTDLNSNQQIPNNQQIPINFQITSFNYNTTERDIDNDVIDQFQDNKENQAIYNIDKVENIEIKEENKQTKEEINTVETIQNREKLITSVIQNHIEMSKSQKKDQINKMVQKNNNKKNCLIFQMKPIYSY